MTTTFGKASKQRLNLASVPRESGAADRLLDNSRQMVRLDLIDDNPRNPRAHVDEESLRELAASIAEHGLLQAPVVRRNPDNPNRYIVVLGSRRVAAHRILGREEIEVIVRRLDDQQAFLASCVENVQRVELSPREEMDMIGVLIDELGSQEAAARALGKSPTWLSKRKRVLAVPALAAAVEHGEISLDHAYDVLARSPDERTILAHLERVRTGIENQGDTREVLAPRHRRASERNVSSRKPASRVATISGRNQAGTNDAQPYQISDRNLASPAEQYADVRAGEVSDRNPTGITKSEAESGAEPSVAVRVAHVAEARVTPASDRNQVPVEKQEHKDNNSDLDLVELSALAILSLARTRGEHALRHEVLRALRQDLETLGKG